MPFSRAEAEAIVQELQRRLRLLQDTRDRKLRELEDGIYATRRNLEAAQYELDQYPQEAPATVDN